MSDPDLHEANIFFKEANKRVLEKIKESLNINDINSSVNIHKFSPSIELRINIKERNRLLAINANQVNMLRTGILDSLIKEEYVKLFRDCLQ